MRGSEEPTVVTIASGKAVSTEEATVYVNDLDVLVTMMLLADSPAVFSLWVYCALEWATHTNGKERVSIIDLICKCDKFQKNLLYPMTLRRRRATDFKPGGQIISRSVAKSCSI